MTTTQRTSIDSKRRNDIKDIVLTLLKETQTYRLPVKLIKIAKQKDWKLFRLSDAKEKGIIGAPKDDHVGGTFLFDNYRCIIYNDNDIRQRIRWTLAHEYGHILLNHKQNSDIAEAEANYFAEQLLSPMAVLDAMDIHTAADIAQACDISVQAAQIRKKDLDRHYKYKAKYGWSKYDKLFLRQFGKDEFF